MRRTRMFPSARIRPGVSIPGAAVESLPGGAVAVYDFARTNFLNWTEDVANTTWTKSGSTASDPSINDPLTGAKAWRITSATADPYIAQFITGNPSGLTVTYSVRVKMEGVITGRNFRFYSYGSNATEAIVSSSFITATGDWQTLTFTRTFPAGMTSTSHVFRVDVPENGAVIGDTVLIASPALNFGAAALPYEKQTDGQTLPDKSGNGNNGTLGATSGAEGTDPTWTAQGLSFDGVDDQAFVPAFPHADYATWFVVMRQDVTPNNASGSIAGFIGKDVSGTIPNQPFGIQMGAVLRPEFVVTTVPSNPPTGAGATVVLQGGATIPLNTPMMLSAVYRDAQLRGYLNGGPIITQSITTGQVMANTTAPLRFGQQKAANSRFMTGTIYYAAIYPRALSDGEVAQAYRVIRRTLALRGVTLP